MIENNLYAKLLGKDAGDLMLAMSILSDAQEVMAMGSVEQARQFINKSKYILSECMDRVRGTSDMYTIIFANNKPSKKQVLAKVRKAMKEGTDKIEVLWGENWIELENVHGYWHGSGWIRDISGQDLANFELNERRSA